MRRCWILLFATFVFCSCNDQPTGQKTESIDDSKIDPLVNAKIGPNFILSLYVDACTPGHMEPPHEHETYNYAICHGYAMARAYGKYHGNATCDPLKTRADYINTSYFEGRAYNFSNLQPGEIVGWGASHSGYVAYKGYDASHTDIDHANYVGTGQYQRNTLQYLINALGTPTVYKRKSTTPCTQQPPSPPAAPYIYSTAYQDTYPQVYWNAVSGATGYKVYRAVGSVSGNYYLIATISSTSYIDYSHTVYSGIGTKQYVYYKVKAYNAGGESPYSNYRQFTCNSIEE